MNSPHDAGNRSDIHSVVKTDELYERTGRAPDFEAEARALSEMATELAEAPRNLLQKLAELVMDLCRADSAGVSLLEQDGDQEVFRWRATAGVFAKDVMGTMPRAASPCGTVIDERRPMLFERPERHFAELANLDPPIYENLNVPFYVEDKPVGTVWVVAHQPDRQFDVEDARLLTSVSRFAAAAYQTLLGLDEATRRLELERQMVERDAELSETHERLRLGEERYQMLFDSIDEGFCIIEVIFDNDGKATDYRFLEVNREFEQHTGLKDAVGRRMREMAPEHEAHWFEIYGKVALTGEPIRFEQRGDAVPHAGWYDLYAFRIDRPEDRHIAVLFTNVTARKQVEAALRESEQRYRELVEQVKDYAIFRIDMHGRAVTWNEGVERLLGFTEGEFIGCHVTEAIFTPEDLAAGIPQKELDDAVRHGTASNDRWMRRKNGEHFFALGATTAIRNSEGRLIGFTKVMRDHTKLYEAEQALRESEERFRTLADAMPQQVWIAEPDGAVTYYNARARQIVGLAFDETSGHWHWRNAVHPDDRERTAQAWTKAVERGRSYRVEHRIQTRKHGDVRYRWHLSRAVPALDESGTIQKWYGTSTDIEATKRAEQRLRESEERFREMADTAPAMLWLTDTDNKRTFISRGWYEYTGQTEPDGLGDGWLAALHPDDRDRVRQEIDDASAKREPFAADYRLRRGDGEYRWVSATARPRFERDGRFLGYIGSVIDVHERKRAEEAVQRSHQELEERIAERTRELRRRAEQLSRLASELSLTEQRERQRLAQVLHDHLQQLLVGANLRLGMLARRSSTAQMEGLSEIRRLIEEAIEASRSLTMELAPPILHEVGLAAGLEWLARWKKEKHNLTVHLNVDHRITVDREDLRIFLFQSVRELLFNVVKHAETDEAFVDVQFAKPDQLQISVEDKGRGFDASGAFDADARGTSGFGLFTIRERLALLGGRLEVQSAPNRGTRFTIEVPIHAEIPKHEQRPWREAGTRLVETEIGGHERGERIRVLVVDDHEVMREGLSVLLSGESGMQVIGEASNGVEAVEQALALHPDIVLMDFSLPAMDGVEATRRIKSELPDVEVIGLSMYEEPDRAAAMIGAGASAYLTKSGNSEDLLCTIRALHGSSA